MISSEDGLTDVMSQPYNGNPIPGKTVIILKQEPGSWFNTKMSSYHYRKSHCGDKTIFRPSYLHNGISYTGKTTSLYWIRAQVLSVQLPLPHKPLVNNSYCQRMWNGASRYLGNHAMTALQVPCRLFPVSLAYLESGCQCIINLYCWNDKSTDDNKTGLMTFRTLSNIVHLMDTTGYICCQSSYISHSLVGNKKFYHSDVVRALPVGYAPTTSSCST